MDRRKFINKAAIATTAVAVAPQLLSNCRGSSIRNVKIRDLLWMWGHEPESIVNTPNLPKGGIANMVEAIDWLGVPNVCVINHGDVVEIPYDDAYIKQFNSPRQVAWSLMSGPEWSPKYDKLRKYSHEHLIKAGFELIDKMPNLTEFYLDDFFSGDGIDETTGLSNANMPLEQLKKLKRDLSEQSRQLQLTLVLYTSQINQGIKEYVNCVDRVSLWTWEGNDLALLEDNFRKYRELVPDKPTLLGIYMWDFGNLTTISLEQMKIQLDFAYEKLKAGDVEGLIFHCTPLCGTELEAVNYSKTWIEEHGDEKISIRRV